MKTIAAACLLLCTLAVGLKADEIKTISKNVPLPTVPPLELPVKSPGEGAADRDTIKLRWSGSPGAGDGFAVKLVTSDSIALVTYRNKKAHLLTDKEAQDDYVKTRGRYYWDADGTPFGKTVFFMGEITLETQTYSIREAGTDWSIFLFTEDGKRIAPIEVSFLKPTLKTNSAPGYRAPSQWVVFFTAKFKNEDPGTKAMLFTGETKLFELAVAGSPGQGKARFKFVQSKGK